MANGASNGSRVSWMSLASLAWTILVACIGGAISTTITLFTMRDAIIQRTDERLLAMKAESKALQQETLARYLTKEDFLEYRRLEQSRSDKQYYDLLTAIRRIPMNLSGPRR